MSDREPDEGPNRCESINPRTGSMCEAYHGHDGEHWFGLSEQWTDAPATANASALADPGEGDAMHAAIQAAQTALDAVAVWPRASGDRLTAEAAVRAAEPILRQAVAEEIAKTAELQAAETDAAAINELEADEAEAGR